MRDKVSDAGAFFRFAARPRGPTTDIAHQSLRTRRLWWAAILLMGLSGGAVGWTIWQLRTDAIDATISDSGNIATILAGQLSRSIGAIDSILLEVKRSQKGLDVDD